MKVPFILQLKIFCKRPLYRAKSRPAIYNSPRNRFVQHEIFPVIGAAAGKSVHEVLQLLLCQAFHLLVVQRHLAIVGARGGSLELDDLALTLDAFEPVVDVRLGGAADLDDLGAVEGGWCYVDVAEVFAGPAEPLGRAQLRFDGAVDDLGALVPEWAGGCGERGRGADCSRLGVRPCGARFGLLVGRGGCFFFAFVLVSVLGLVPARHRIFRSRVMKNPWAGTV